MNLLKAVSHSRCGMDQSLDLLKLAEQMQALTAGNLSFDHPDRRVRRRPRRR